MHRIVAKESENGPKVATVPAYCPVCNRASMSFSRSKTGTVNLAKCSPVIPLPRLARNAFSSMNNKGIAEDSASENRLQHCVPAIEFGREEEPRIVGGRIKWFDPERGFGFVQSEEVDCDILLHANVLSEFGQTSISSGSLVRILVQDRARGLQAVELISVKTPNPDGPVGTGHDLTDLTRPVDSSVPYLPARVKWFDHTKGFGFANTFRDDRDVFLHASVLQRFGLTKLAPAEAICLRAVDRENGRVAVEVRRWNFPPPTVAHSDATSLEGDSRSHQDEGKL